MTIHLPENIERSIVAAVQNGRFPSVDEAVTAAWIAFNEPATGAAHSQTRTLDALHRQMFADGLLTHLPDEDADIDDDDEPVVIEGEPLSETIIRERR